MTGFPEFVRNVAVVGHLHHGKTALMDMLVFETHKLVWDSDNEVRFQLFTGCTKSPNSMVFSDTVYRHSRPFTRTRNLN